MKASVKQDETGIQWEIKDDGSAEYQKAAQLTREVNERQEHSREAMRQPGGSFMHFFQGDEAALRIIVKQQRAEIEQLKRALLSGEERTAIDWAATVAAQQSQVAIHKTLRRLLRRWQPMAEPEAEG